MIIDNLILFYHKLSKYFKIYGVHFILHSGQNKKLLALQYYAYCVLFIGIHCFE